MARNTFTGTLIITTIIATGITEASLLAAKRLRGTKILAQPTQLSVNAGVDDGPHAMDRLRLFYPKWNWEPVR